MGWRECKRSTREHRHGAAPGLQKHNRRDSIKMTENSILSVPSRFNHSRTCDKFLTSRGYSVHCRAELPLPLLRQTSLAESLKMCLHGGVHGQEIALKEATECSGSHFSYLENKGRKRRWDVEVQSVLCHYRAVLITTHITMFQQSAWIKKRIILELAASN